jgi:hypothetical protein
MLLDLLDRLAALNTLDEQLKVLLDTGEKRLRLTNVLPLA